MRAADIKFGDKGEREEWSELSALQKEEPEILAAETVMLDVREY